MSDKALAELESCPFCGAERCPEVIGRRFDHEDGLEYFACEGCGACGPRRDTATEALTAWNTRNQPANTDHTDAALADELERALAEGLWALARKALGMRADYMPLERTDFTAMAAAKITALRTTATVNAEQIEHEPDCEYSHAPIRLCDCSFRIEPTTAEQPAEPQPSVVERVSCATVGEVKSVLRAKLDLSDELLADMDDNLTEVAVAVMLAMIPAERPKHAFWRPGEPDCPREIKAGNGELHTLRCKVCGQDNPRDDRCRIDATLTNGDG